MAETQNQDSGPSSLSLRTKTAIGLFSLAGIALVGSLVAGCTLDRLIQVDIPPSMQSGVTESSVSLREAPHFRESYMVQVRQNIESFDGNVEDAMLIFNTISAGISLGLDEAGKVSGGIPGGALAIGGLTTLGALFTRRPGDKTAEELRKEKERSYSKGQDDLRTQLISLGVKLTDETVTKVVDKAVQA